MSHARAVTAALLPYAVALTVPAHGAADFGVTVNLRPPQGCSASVTPTGAEGAPQVTLTCGANLYVNVQPTVLTVAAGSSPIASFAPAAPGITGSAAAAPASTFQDVSSLMSLNDTRTSVGGALFVQRRATAGDAQGAPMQTSTNLSQLLVEPTPGAAANLAGQPVEMWLIF